MKDSFDEAHRRRKKIGKCRCSPSEKNLLLHCLKTADYSINRPQQDTPAALWALYRWAGPPDTTALTELALQSTPTIKHVTIPPIFWYDPVHLWCIIVNWMVISYGTNRTTRRHDAQQGTLAFLITFPEIRHVASGQFSKKRICDGLDFRHTIIYKKSTFHTNKPWNVQKYNSYVRCFMAVDGVPFYIVCHWVFTVNRLKRLVLPCRHGIPLLACFKGVTPDSDIFPQVDSMSQFDMEIEFALSWWAWKLLPSLSNSGSELPIRYFEK